ncbi:MAG: hypothetical protein IKQ46_06740 [Bacteroidales bacterium]|nr:hypothetical protein [Bacteroidales bacterium]
MQILIAQMLQDEFNISEQTLDAFLLQSNIYQELNNENSNLRKQSAEYIYQSIKEEYLAWMFDDDEIGEMPEGQFVRSK